MKTKLELYTQKCSQYFQKRTKENPSLSQVIIAHTILKDEKTNDLYFCEVNPRCRNQPELIDFAHKFSIQELEAEFAKLGYKMSIIPPSPIFMRIYEAHHIFAPFDISIEI